MSSCGIQSDHVSVKTRARVAPILVTTLSLMMLLPTGGANPLSGGALAAETGIVLGDVTYTGEVRFTQGLVVSAGATLRFEYADVLLDLDPADCPEACGVGQLDIYVAPGGSLLIYNSTISSSILINGEPKRWTIHGAAATIYADGSEFEGGDHMYFELPGERASILTNNDFTGMAGAITWTRGAELTVRGNAFQTKDTALYLRDVKARVVGNHFGSEGDATAAYNALRIISSQVGAATQAFADYEVIGNHFEDRSSGLGVVGETPFPIRNNTFHDVRIPLQLGLLTNETLGDARFDIRGNVFSGNMSTVMWTHSGNASAVIFQENDILDPFCSVATDYDFSAGAIWVDARHNWWGSPDGPQLKDGASCGLGRGLTDVVVDPWATEPFH